MKYDVLLSPNCNPRGANPIERITVHCVVGHFPAKTVAEWFAKPARKASSNWIVGKSGDYCLSVQEDHRAWTSGNAHNDYRAITIETSCDATAPYAFSDIEYKALVDLVVDIMKRYKRTKLIYPGSKAAAEAYKVQPGEMILTFHRYYQNVACPGQWFVNHAESFTEEVNRRLNGTQPRVLYKVQVGAYAQKENALKMQKQLKEKGFDGFIVEVVQ